MKALQAHPHMNSVLCLTAQHREMLDQVLQIFAIKADFDLDLMQPSQTAAMPVTNCTPRSSAWDDGKSDHQMIRRRQRIRSPVAPLGCRAHFRLARAMSQAGERFRGDNSKRRRMGLLGPSEPTRANSQRRLYAIVLS